MRPVKSKFSPPSVKRIIVIPLRFIGDAVLTVPLLRAIRLLYPQAHIDVMVPAAVAPMLELCPYIDDCLIEPRGSMATLTLLRQRRYDMAILCRRSVTQALMTLLAGIKYRLGYDEQRWFKPLNYRRWGIGLTSMVIFPPVDSRIPHVKSVLNLLTPILPLTSDDPDRPSQSSLDTSLELWADEADKLKVASVFNQAGIGPDAKLAVIHLSSASREKAMPIESFVDSVQRLHQAGYTLVSIGVANEADRYEQLQTLSSLPIHNLCGKTSLRQTFVVLLKTALLFSIDSAPIHMAAAADVPHIIGIYGPTNEHQWKPYPYHGQFTAITNTDLTCRPCVPKICEHNRCRTELTVDRMASQLQAHLNTIVTGHETIPRTVLVNV